VFVVTGLGLVGLLAVQILRAHGCRVLGIDVKAERVSLARRFGACGVDLSAGQDPVAAAMEASDGRGVDGVLLAAATRSSEPVHQAAQMCRKRGRIVLVGVTGLELRREDFYRKELTFQVSCSYGPGRYDPEYEDKGQDYPYGFVRWTARRNFEAVLQLLAEGKLDVVPLITRRVPIEEAPALYEGLGKGDASIGSILTYPDQEKRTERTVRLRAAAPATKGGQDTVVGVIGAGNFATRTILPLLQKANVRRKLIVTRGGLEAALAGGKFGFEEATTETERVWADGEVNTVFILTPHGSHADLVCGALGAGKHVFVEKPLATTARQLDEVRATYQAAAGKSGGAPLLHVGFNRRFAPFVVKMKELLASCPGPKSLMMMVNAGQVEADHWIQDAEVGGGRIVGEACHFIDLLRFLAGASIVGVQPMALPLHPGRGARDTLSIALTFEDGSIGTVHYWANGSRAYPKERLEVFAGGRALVLENFRRLRGYGWPGFRSVRSWWRQDKGHAAEVASFVRCVRSGAPPLIPFDELVEVTEVVLRAAGSS
jgi:predicted dehydrogenase